MESLWRVIHVLSRTEKAVAERLEKRGITVYLPIQKQLRQWSDRKKWVDMVVLSGYVFVKINKNEHRQTLETPGVSRFLKHDTVPVSISDSEMQRFKDFIEKANNRNIEFTTEKLPAGTPVTIQAGNFKGFSGEVVEYKNKRRLSVKLSNFGHFFVTLALEDVLADTSTTLSDRNWQS